MAVDGIEAARLALATSDLDQQTCLFQAADALPAHEWIRVDLGDDHPAHAGILNQRHARRRSLVGVAAGFQRDVERRARRATASLSQREHLCMGTAGPAMIALADNTSAGHDHRSDHGIRTGAAPALRREAKGQFHVPLVTVGLSHRFLRADRPRDLTEGLADFRLEWVLALAAGVAFLLSCSASAA